MLLCAYSHPERGGGEAIVGDTLTPLLLASPFQPCNFSFILIYQEELISTGGSKHHDLYAGQ